MPSGRVVTAFRGRWSREINSIASQELMRYQRLRTMKKNHVAISSDATAALLAALSLFRVFRR